ncbi:MAG: hypothetical protein RLZZ143_3217, partial [Cyanobacteriota bacterium]
MALIYTSIAGNFKEVPSISISELVQKINAGEVKSIAVRDSDLSVQLNDGKELKAKKENESALSETFKNYGIP